MQIQDKRIPRNINTYTDANWASCETTRKSAGNDTNQIKKALECYVVKSPRSGVLVQIRCKPHVAGLVGRGVR